MNKQEFQQKLKDMKPPKFFNAITLREAYEAGFEEAKGNALCDSCFLDVPEKPVVPKFVVDWVDNSREYRFDFDEWFDWNNQPKTVQLWLNSENKRQAELNALALVTLIVRGANAVEIEQEKLYTVELPNPNAGGHVVLCKTSDGIVSIAFTGMARWQGCKNFQLTEAEIKKDFAWAFRWAKEVKE